MLVWLNSSDFPIALARNIKKSALAAANIKQSSAPFCITLYKAQHLAEAFPALGQKGKILLVYTFFISFFQFLRFREWGFVHNSTVIAACNHARFPCTSCRSISRFMMLSK